MFIWYFHTKESLLFCPVAIVPWRWKAKEPQFYCVSNEGSLLLLAIHKLWSEALSRAQQQAKINGNVNFNWALCRLFSAITKWKVRSIKKELWTVLGTTQKSQWEWRNALCASDWLLFFSSSEFRNQTATNQRHYWFLQSYTINTGFFGSIRGCTREDAKANHINYEQTHNRLRVYPIFTCYNKESIW